MMEVKMKKIRASSKLLLAFEFTQFTVPQVNIHDNEICIHI